MKDQTQMQAPQIDLGATKSIEHENGVIFQQGVVLREVSKFITGTDENGVMPIPVFYDPISNKILESTLPKELREEYSEHTIK